MNWPIKRLRPYRYWLLLAVLTAVFFGCLTKQEPDTFTLPEKFVDSLSQYDSVQIILKDTSGKTLDVLFHGKVVFADQLRDLPAPHALEGEMLVTIIGYQSGKVTYRVDRLYNGKTRQVETHQPIILPTSKVSFAVPELRIPKKTTLPLPVITVEPADLADKTLVWTSSNPKIFEIGAKGLLGITPGTAFLRVSLKADTAKHADIPVTVVANPKLPDSLRISPDTLKLAAKGRAGQFIVQAFPATAGAVDWRLEGDIVASISGSGWVQGIKRGTALVRVVSKEDETISDSAMVAVSDPIPVESVRFPKNKLDLFVEGAAESLLVEVRPLEANPEAVFSVRDSSIARVLNGRVLGLREGVTDVIARSSENPAKTDSLRVTVYPTQRVDSLRLSPDTLRLYVGGEAGTLQAELSPSSLAPLIQWNSASPSIAAVDSAGRVNPVSEGKTIVTATSKADSGKKDASLIQVKRDVPILDVGRDTTISVGQTVTFTPKVTQEYGTVIRFKWDLDGDGAWDDSASELKSFTYKYDLEKEAAVAFYVRDTEGNDTSVVKRVKAVIGPVIIIFAPLNNSYTNKSPIAVAWSVDGKDQEVFLKEILKEGVNTITRTAKDSLGNVYSASITVYYDTTAPNKPSMNGPVKTNSATPTWTWSSGGRGGFGIYRYSIDNEDFSGAVETKDTSFTWEKGFKDGVYTLYVQERDNSGNWSASGRLSIQVDLTPPSMPILAVSPISPTNIPTPVWTWISGGYGDRSWFRYKLNDSVLSVGSVSGTGKTYQPTLPGLQEGVHTLYVQEQDSAGNWSPVASKEIMIDLTPPAPPNVTSGLLHTTNLKPTWQWSSSGAGGGAGYRYKLNDSDTQVGGTLTNGTSITPPADLNAGTQQTLYVQERDSAGNWSRAGFFRVKIHGQIGYAVGEMGAIIKTTNGGDTWDTVYSGLAHELNSENLASVYFTDPNSGYAVGSSGVMIKTTNGGGTWSRLTSGTGVSLTSVYFTDAKTGYVLKENGGILKTTNGGASWDSLTRRTTQYLGAICFPDPNNGYAVGAAGTILKTRDGGLSWELTSTPTTSNLNSVYFTDANVGFAAGAGGTIIRTSNGGLTWNLLSTGTNKWLFRIFFTTKDVGTAVGDGGIVLKTLDGGDHWEELKSGVPDPIISVFFTDFKTGFASAGQATILKTVDGGESWAITTNIVTYSGRNSAGTGGWEKSPSFISVCFP